MGKPSAPKPPDYAGAAQQQGQANVQAAIAQAMLGRVNQVTPYGSLTWSNGPDSSFHMNTASPTSAGGGSLKDIFQSAGAGGGAPGAPGGSGIDIPQGTATMTLSPEMQKIFDQFTQNQQKIGGVAGNLLGQAGDTLSSPFDPSKLPADSTQQAVQDAMYNRQAQYLDPQFALAQKALDTKLANQGFQINNEGYDKAQSTFGDTRQKAYADARDSAIQQGASLGLAQRQQAVSEALAARNQPINELSALMSGSQVTQPQFQNTSAPNIAPAPIMAGTEAGANAALQNFGIQSGMYNSQLGGLMGLGGLGMLGMMGGGLSDRRLKKNVHRIGTHPLGIGIYSFDYLWGQPAVGVMADEVERVLPEAVFVTPGGYKGVDYKMLANPVLEMIP